MDKERKIRQYVKLIATRNHLNAQERQNAKVLPYYNSLFFQKYQNFGYSFGAFNIKNINTAVARIE